MEGKMGAKRGTITERLWRYVEQRGPDECWPWTGATDRRGYGKMGAGGEHGHTLTATRVMWDAIHPEDPLGPDDCALHKCDNPGCVNPAHLFKGTRKDNMQDCSRKGRVRYEAHSGEDNGHARLTEAKVRQAKRWLQQGKTHLWISRKLGVAESTIWYVAHNITWRHVVID